MISAGDFRNGVTIEIEGNVCQIVEFQHVKPGKGAAFVRTKYKNIITGAVLEKSFRPTEKFPQARIDRVDMSYLYNDGDLYNFMNTETYDQVALTKEQVGDSLKFVKENEVVKVCSWNGNVYAIEPPLFVELEVIETEPGFAGNTAQGATITCAPVSTVAGLVAPCAVFPANPGSVSITSSSTNRGGSIAYTFPFQEQTLTTSFSLTNLRESPTCSLVSATWS